tara:strand:+ start:562 stop:891 length:330 start_codon:yes stop_codon:yes gene_type:complete
LTCNGFRERFPSFSETNSQIKNPGKNVRDKTFAIIAIGFDQITGDGYSQCSPSHGPISPRTNDKTVGKTFPKSTTNEEIISQQTFYQEKIPKKTTIDPTEHRSIPSARG